MRVQTPDQEGPGTARAGQRRIRVSWLRLSSRGVGWAVAVLGLRDLSAHISTYLYISLHLCISASARSLRSRYADVSIAQLGMFLALVSFPTSPTSARSTWRSARPDRASVPGRIRREFVLRPGWRRVGGENWRRVSAGSWHRDGAGRQRRYAQGWSVCRPDIRTSASVLRRVANGNSVGLAGADVMRSGSGQGCPAIRPPLSVSSAITCAGSGRRFRATAFFFGPCRLLHDVPASPPTPIQFSSLTPALRPRIFVGFIRALSVSLIPAL